MGSRSRILLYFMIAAVFLVVGITIRLPQLLEEPVSKSTGEVAIGGDFTLVDPKGNTVTNKDLLGSYTLMYFGYTFCPDVCPTGLQTAASALDLLPMRKSNKVVSLFITVDPERDTPEVMGEYVKHFHKSLVGLTGTVEQVTQTAKAYKIYFKKVVEEGKPADEYLMDHSAFQYLMGPDGKYVTHFPHGISPEDMAEKLKAYIR
ncbi:Classical-complement-pathway C3/C5 convertase [Candidatus Terasakiella magnetica]|uniref:Classical-complement-pathway C3/C5 convertase n=1 Tax=Candidatus Terasakiella magnetica TaxID=1867952 RepID=A0A1C3RLW6_9PROT|nr:SCO family protein [Candidatus Terasakiella magnetica]SCA58208.1 Classical-complement-pathway C3/C5 convertase [Candidatus Terasakiella magnetica]